jgi:hypothetical protein
MAKSECIDPNKGCSRSLVKSMHGKERVHRSKRRLQPEFGKIDAWQRASASIETKAAAGVW